MKISIIGTGNVANHLVRAFRQVDIIELSAICGTTLAKTKSIKGSAETLYLTDVGEVPKSDIIIICVQDKNIRRVADALSKNNFLQKTIIAHTSGSIASTVLDANTNYGVFYPLQTFTKGRKLSFKRIPICICGSSPKVIKKIAFLGGLISQNVREITDSERQDIHLSAVLVNNLVNHILYLSRKRLTDIDIDDNILFPLIEETVRKTKYMTPFDAQTGPAKRADKKVISTQMKKLQGSPALLKIYTAITESIIKTYT